MKKILCILTALVLVFSISMLTSCDKEKNPDVEIILCTPARAFFPDGESDGLTSYDIQPKIVESIRNRIRTFALLNSYKCVDIYSVTENHGEWFSDRVHPSNEGALAIAEAIAKKIIE